MTVFTSTNGFRGSLKDVPFALSLSKGGRKIPKPLIIKPLMVRQAHHERLNLTALEKPLPLAQRRAFVQAVKTAVMPLMAEGARPTTDFLSYALLIVALHTGRNLTPLLEMNFDCLRPHPGDKTVFLVCYKRRGNTTSSVPLRDEREIEFITSTGPTVAQLIRRVIELTGPLRQEVPEHLKDRIWLILRRRKSKLYGKLSALNDGAFYSVTKKLIKDFGLKDSDGNPLRINVRRLRATFINRIYEILNNDQIATAAAAGNSVPVVGNYYLRPGEEAKRNWKFMGLTMTEELLSGTVGATEKTPTGRCTDISQGQFAPKRDGALCTSFLDCLRCRNYVVTGDDLYRLFSFYWRIYQERARMDVKKWDKHYQHIIRLIDRDVIGAGMQTKVFRQEEVDAARELALTQPHPFWATLPVLGATQ